MSVEFDSKGTYLHGDFGLRNSMIESDSPMKVKIFDPNPLIGDPTWDIASFLKTTKFHEKKSLYIKRKSVKEEYEIYRLCFKGFFRFYEKESGKRINPLKVSLSEAIQGLVNIKSEEDRARIERNSSRESDIKIRREYFLEKFNAVTTLYI